MNIRIEGIDELFADLKRLGKVSETAVVDTINDLAMDTHEKAVRGIQRGPASGRTYKRGAGTHRASAPGEYPMSDTGRLASNVQFTVATKAKPQALVGTNIVYGAYLEFGTSKMSARPWLMPSFQKAVVGVAAELKAKLKGQT